MAICLSSADAWGEARTLNLSTTKAEAARQVSDLALRLELAPTYVNFMELPRVLDNVTE